MKLKTKAKLAALLPAAGATAVAIPIQSPITNLQIPITVSGIYLNVVTGVSSSNPGSALGWDLNGWGTTSANFWANNSSSPNDGVMAAPGGLVGNLPLGTVVDSSGTFLRTASSTTSGSGAFVVNATNYIGFRFLNEGDGQMHFGWASVILSGALSTAPRSFGEIWYESEANTGIQVGATGAATGVPEPSSAALLALGAAGLAALRRRNRK